MQRITKQLFRAQRVRQYLRFEGFALYGLLIASMENQDSFEMGKCVKFAVYFPGWIRSRQIDVEALFINTSHCK